MLPPSGDDLDDNGRCSGRIVGSVDDDGFQTVSYAHRRMNSVIVDGSFAHYAADVHIRHDSSLYHGRREVCRGAATFEESNDHPGNLDMS